MLFEKWKAKLDNESIKETVLTIRSRLEQYHIEKREIGRIALRMEDA